MTKHKSRPPLDENNLRRRSSVSDLAVEPPNRTVKVKVHIISVNDSEMHIRVSQGKTTKDIFLRPGQSIRLPNGEEFTFESTEDSGSYGVGSFDAKRRPRRTFYGAIGNRSSTWEI